MKNIIETLYINLNRPQVPNDPELEDTEAEYSKMCDILKAQYGPDFLDRFTALRERLDQRSQEREFFFGFQTCARLLLEAFV